MHNVFVKLDQLNRHKELSKRLKALPDINNVVPLSAPTIVHTDNQSNNQNNMIEMPLIELEEHERFTDINDQVVDIEVRGELCKLIAEINTQHELALLKMEFDYTKQLRDRDNENNRLKASIEIQRLTYENKLLSMELVMNKLSLTK
jgi:hypothetical protein